MPVGVGVFAPALSPYEHLCVRLELLRHQNEAAAGAVQEEAFLQCCSLVVVVVVVSRHVSTWRRVSNQR